MVNVNHITVEVFYALPEQTSVVSLKVKPGTNIKQAIEMSGLLQQFPEISLDENRVGIYSKLKALDTLLRDGDRIEIYRALKVDPKEARRRRAEKRNNKK